MTKENIIKLYKHFCEVAAGKVEKTSNPVRNELIISDAKKNKADLELKFPFLTNKKEAE